MIRRTALIALFALTSHADAFWKGGNTVLPPVLINGPGVSCPGGSTCNTTDNNVIGRISPGEWTGADTITCQWQYSNNGFAPYTNAPGSATSCSLYTIDVSLAGKFVIIRERATNAGGSTDANSNAEAVAP